MTKQLLLGMTCIFVCALACKKEKLTGDDKSIAGTWKWIYSTGGLFGGVPKDESYHRTLIIKEKGKYQYFNNDKKLGHGILIKNNGYYEFLNREVIGNDDISGQKIIRHFGDTLIISRAICCDHFDFVYVKEK